MKIFHRKEHKQFLAQDLAIVRDIASPGNSSLKNISFAEIKIPPGSSTLEHYHIESEEIFYILEGNGSISVADESCQINIGDTIIVLPGEKHCVINEGNNDLVFLAVCSPYYCDDDQIILK